LQQHWLLSCTKFHTKSEILQPLFTLVPVRRRHLSLTSLTEVLRLLGYVFLSQSTSFSWSQNFCHSLFWAWKTLILFYIIYTMIDEVM
jgi:hypothetical protein